MKKVFVAFLGGMVISAMLNPIARCADQQGPLGVINRLPSHIFFLTPSPHSPEALPKNTIHGAFDFNYFSVYSYAASSRHRILMDMEATVLELRLAYGLTDRLSLGVRVPMVSMGDGFMDSELEDFHAAFGLPNYGKERRPKDQFAYVIKTDNQPWFDSKKGGVNLTDSTLSAKFEVLKSGKTAPLRLGLTYEAKLPTGDKRHGFGSGASDHGLFLPVKLSFSRINTYFMPGYIRIGKPEFESVDLSVRDIKSLFVGGEYLLSPAISLLAQVNSYTSPFIHTGIVKLDTFSSELALGMRYSFSNQMSLELAFCEDLTRTSPDFNFHLMFSFAEGPKNP